MMLRSSFYYDIDTMLLKWKQALYQPGKELPRIETAREQKQF
jgi:hypothetical protein